MRVERAADALERIPEQEHPRVGKRLARRCSRESRAGRCRSTTRSSSPRAPGLVDDGELLASACRTGRSSGGTAPPRCRRRRRRWPSQRNLFADARVAGDEHLRARPARVAGGGLLRDGLHPRQPGLVERVQVGEPPVEPAVVGPERAHATRGSCTRCPARTARSWRSSCRRSPAGSRSGCAASENASGLWLDHVRGGVEPPLAARRCSPQPCAARRSPSRPARSGSAARNGKRLAFTSARTAFEPRW